MELMGRDSLLKLFECEDFRTAKKCLNILGVPIIKLGTAVFVNKSTLFKMLEDKENESLLAISEMQKRLEKHKHI